jgi:hypothetical protein
VKAKREVRGDQDLIGRMLGELESRQPVGLNQHFHVHFDEPIEVTRFIALTGRYPTDKERRDILDGVKPAPKAADVF